MKKLLAISALFFFMLNSAGAQNNPLKIRSWVCFYGDSFPSKPKYDLYILDSANHPDPAPLKKQGSVVVGYVSAGEINKKDPNFKKVPKNLLLDENKQWGSYRVNIKNKKWRDFVLTDLIPQVLSHGFDGIFIDTIDVASYLENEKKMKGEIVGAVSLINEIRNRYPEITIVLNGGLFLLDLVGLSIDALVVEDVYTLYDFKDKKYLLADENWTQERLRPIRAFREKFSKPVLSLDYVDPTDKNDIELVANKAKSEGLIPYISDIDLKKIFFHP